MTLSRVTGCIVSTQKSARLAGHRLLAVQTLRLDGTLADGPEDVALDPGLDAGEGDTVLVVKEGAVVADLFDADGALPTPANVVIVAVVDAAALPLAAG